MKTYGKGKYDAYLLEKIHLEREINKVDKISAEDPMKKRFVAGIRSAYCRQLQRIKGKMKKQQILNNQHEE